MKWLTASRANAILLALVLIVGGGNLLATHAQVQSQAAAQRREQAAQAAQQRREELAQRRAGEAVEHKLCTTFAKLAKRKPPPGSPKTNPSRAYLQGQHDTLDEIPVDLGCGKKRS